MCLAVPGRILGISGEEPLLRSARVDYGGIVREVSLAYAPEAKVDDYVLVHAGFALTVIAAAEAERVFRHLEEIGAIAQELVTERAS
jgi:hydrogenase expression/formation protein HypC